MPFIPDAHYISSFLMQGQQELRGFHLKVTEIEALRYGERKSGNAARDRQTGKQVRTLLTADLIESVKAAMLANPPKAKYRPLRTGKLATDNANMREKIANARLKSMNRPVPVLAEGADSQVGLGLGIFKDAYSPWPVGPRRKKKDETDKQYLKRLKMLKRQWGMPFSVTTPHLLTWYFRLGVGNKVVECLEHSYRPRLEVYSVYGIGGEDDRKFNKGASKGTIDSKAFDEEQARRFSAVSGQPDETVRPLPYGADTTTMIMVDEYWNPDVYQVWVAGRLLYQETNPHVCYFPAIGASSSSHDPDKIGISVAEGLRFNEPLLDDTLTAMAEAADLLLHPALAIETDKDAPDDSQPILGQDNDPQKNFVEFKKGLATPLKRGRSVKNPFTDASQIYEAMPFVSLMQQTMSQHGVAPIFKGMPPGAAGSGYRDNSLYQMARARFQYIQDGYEAALTEMIKWEEQQIVDLDLEVCIDEMELRPKDIEEFPCIIEVKLDPVLPNNQIAQGQFYMDAHKEGYGDRQWVYEKGFNEEQSGELEDRRLLEKAQDFMMPMVIQDAMQRLGIGQSQPGAPGAPPAPTILDKNGNPMAPSNPAGPGGAQQMMSAFGGASGGGGGNPGLLNAQTPPAQPPFQPGSFPPQRT